MAAGMSSQAGASKPGFHQQMTELIMAPAANATAAHDGSLHVEREAGCRADDQRGNDMAIDEGVYSLHLIRPHALPDRARSGRV